MSFQNIKELLTLKCDYKKIFSLLAIICLSDTGCGRFWGSATYFSSPTSGSASCNAWDQPDPPQVSVTASDKAPNADFTWGVSVSGNIVVIGAEGKTEGGHANAGAAYVFDISNPLIPVQDAILTASDKAAGDVFGGSVSVSGNIAVIGAYEKTEGGHASAGAAYVFDISNPLIPVQDAILTASDGATNDEFGTSVSVSGNRAVIGALNGGLTEAGAAYVFDISNPLIPVQVAILAASDGVSGDGFGTSVSVSGNSVVIGAPNKTEGGQGFAGAAYTFDISNPLIPVQGAILTASDAVGFGFFGNNVSVSGNSAVIGATNEEAYTFDISNPLIPVQEAILTASDGVAGDDFGFSVSISGNRAVIDLVPSIVEI